ncbi:hypothetical protein PV797_11855 [Clostridiaceae bacterium M8S5]|nr:hypothetical protein PV797_11855 [Clostridiaceae bacterium M8S5]
MKNLLESDIEYFIPEHGPVCSKDKVRDMIEYILTSLVKKSLEIHKIIIDFYIDDYFLCLRIV